MHAVMTASTYPLYCRVCGHPWEGLRDLPLDHAIAMKWWEMDNLVKGLGCPKCEGQVPTYIRDMTPEDRDHVDRGFTIQWSQAVKKACKPSHLPYPEFPLPAFVEFFLWAEPTVNSRFSEMGKDVEDLIASIDGGADALRVHPEASASPFDNYRFGLWHVVSPQHASVEAETSSIKYMNAILLKDVFAGKCDILGGNLWVLIGTDMNGALALDVDTLSRISVVEAAMKKYACLTPEVFRRVTGEPA